MTLPSSAATFFRPAAALVGRLRYAHKFLVVGLVLLVPLGYVALAYVDLQRSQIAFSAREREGVEVLAPLIALTGNLIEARHLNVAQGPNTTTTPPHLAAAVAAGVARLDELQRRPDGPLAAAATWPQARDLVLAAGTATGGEADRYAAYNTAVDALLALVVGVGDHSNLTLDPDLDTYYLMDVLQFRLPVLLDTAGRSVDGATLATRTVPVARAPGGAGDEVFIELGLLAGVLASTHKSVTRDVEIVRERTASATTRTTVQARLAALDRAAVPLTETLTGAVTARRADTVPVHSGDALRGAATAFAADTATELDLLLGVRIDRLEDRARRVVLLFCLAALLAVYLFVGFYQSVTTPIRRIVATLHAVAAGDLTSRVAVASRDELGFVATALNDTIARTEVATERLARQATRDALTSLPNRTLVLDRLQAALDRSRRTSALMAVLFVDLDRFKIINDSLGHEAGDAVLREIAARLRTIARSRDTVGRLAGDEFVLVCEDLANPEEAVGISERVIAALGREVVLDGPTTAGREVSVGASVGIAFADGSAALDPADLLRDADVAMYRAKQRGRGRAEIFDDGLRIAVERKLEVQDELRRAVEEDQIHAYYQPIVDSGTGAVLGLEALARWQHPVRGLLEPPQFLGVAEETGLVVPVGALVLAAACRQMAAWRQLPRGGELRIGVNASGAQFNHPSFVPAVRAALDDSGLDPDALWLEITESSIMDETGADTLTQLRALGVHLCIDDFGTGYSSLMYLRRLPVEALKIDHSFVAGLDLEQADEAIVTMVLGLARTLDLPVVAEGVETAGQLARLNELGCFLVQGYHLAPPLPADEATALLAGTATVPLTLPEGPVRRPDLPRLGDAPDRRADGAAAGLPATGPPRVAAPS